MHLLHTIDYTSILKAPIMTFDTQSFLDSSVSGANDTVVVPVPAGEYPAVIDTVTARPWQSRDGTSSGISLDVVWIIDDAEVKQALGRDTVKCKQGIMLELVTVNGKDQLDTSKGKNVGLGRLRKAVNLNNPDQSFSFSMLPGQMARVKVSHRIAGEDTFAEIKSVAPM